MSPTIRRYLALATKEVQQLRRNRVLLIQLMLPPTVVLVTWLFKRAALADKAPALAVS